MFKSRNTKQRPSRLTALAIIALLGAHSSGCSFVFVDAPPDHPEQVPVRQNIDCSTSKTSPVLDVIAASFQAIRTGFAVGANDSVYEDPDQPLSRGADIGIGLGLTALFVTSAIYGFNTVSDCKDAKFEHAVKAEAEAERDRQRSAPEAPPQPAAVAAPQSAPTAPAVAPAPASSASPAPVPASSSGAP